MSHRRSVSTISAASSAPILVNPTANARTRPSPSDPEDLRYPYPLNILILLDFAYTVHHTYNHTTNLQFKLLLCLRVLVIGVLLGCSRRWRTRGGLVALTSCLTVGSCVWEGCAGQLHRGRRTLLGISSDDGNGSNMGHVHTMFLIITSCIAISDFLIYLLCLRISPPPHRIHPLSIRNPTVQSPTAFSFSFNDDDDPEERFFTTSTPRRTRAHRRITSISRNDVFSAPGHDPSNDEREIGEEDEEEEEVQLEFSDDDDSFSSISESSIIDLPPPLSPSRIRPPVSLSIPRALNLVALDETPVLRPLVRRSRSARFLVGSLGRRDREEMDVGGNEMGMGRAISAAAGPSSAEGYGTFDG